MFQRDIGGTSKSVTISGTYANMDWSRVEARALRHGTDTSVEFIPDSPEQITYSIEYIGSCDQLARIILRAK